MAWWNKVLTAAKSAVGKVVSTVKAVSDTVVKAVSSTVKKVSTAVKVVTNYVIEDAKEKIDAAKKVTQVVKDTVVKAVSEKIEEVKEKTAEVEKTVTKEIVAAAKWPKMPVDLPEKLIPYWKRMEDAYNRKDRDAMLQVLRELIPLEASPIPALALIFAVVGVASLVLAIVGSYPFAGFIREEALQTIDFGIRTATYQKDVEGLEKAIAFKKELLERTFWEKIISAVPVVTVLKELRDFYKASRIKLEIDERLLDRLRMEMTGEGLPEKIKAVVRDIIDGDTIDISLEATNLETGEGIKLPEYATTGHARVRIVGINAPEKSPKGEILCTDVEIYKVEGKYATLSRERLWPLNDKEVILKIDPSIPVDTHGRILAVVDYGGVDIGLRQIREGLACRYYREPNKYVDEDLYKEETLTAKEEGVGMWEYLEEIEKEEEKIKILIDSKPSNAKLYVDDIYTTHRTPSNEVELSDVMHLFTLGRHILEAEKGGDSGMVEVEIVKGDNGKILIDLETAPLPVPPKVEVPVEEVPEVEVPIEVVPVIVEEPVKPEEIPSEYTSEQEWALSEAFLRIENLTKGVEQMSETEYKELVEDFNLYTEDQKKVLDLLFRDVWILIKGKEIMSEAEFEELKEKYRIK